MLFYMELKIGLIGSYCGRPLDILLPVINENELTEKHKSVGHCFHLNNLEFTELCLFSKNSNGTRRTALLDIGSSCKPDSDISIYLVSKPNGDILLHTYIDDEYNGMYPLPYELLH